MTRAKSDKVIIACAITSGIHATPAEAREILKLKGGDNVGF